MSEKDKSTIVDAYRYDEFGKYLDTIKIQIINDNPILPPGRIVLDKPDLDSLEDGECAVYDTETNTWLYGHFHVGDLMYNKETKEATRVTVAGPIPDDYTLQVPFENCTWGAGEWTDDVPVQTSALKEHCFGIVNNNVSNRITSGLVMNGMTIWLSVENQNNINSLHNRAILDYMNRANENYTPSVTLPVSLWETVGDGIVEFDLTTLEEVLGFCDATVKHIEECRAIALTEKRRIMDMTKAELENYRRNNDIVEV